MPQALTSVQIANLAIVSKLGGAEITSLASPTNGNERRIAVIYAQCKVRELRKRRWYFAKKYTQLTPLAGTVPGDTLRPYRYLLPPDCLRPLRRNQDRWKRVSNGMLASDDNSLLDLEFIADVDEGEFDPCFVDVLAASIAKECAEWITQSNTKKQDVISDYRDLIQIASQQNAFENEPEGIQDDDASSEWLTGHHYPDMVR